MLLADAIRVLTQAARLRRLRSMDTSDTGAEPVDFAEFAALALAATAANVGGIEELLAGRPGSWEADHLRNLLTSTVGYDEQHLWEHRTEPVVIAVPVDQILNEIGVRDVFDDSAREVWRLQAEVGDELTEESEAETNRLAKMEDDLEALMEAEWVAYGNAFRASVLEELEREPIPGLRVPVEFAIDARPWQPDSTHRQEPATGPLARLYEAGWCNTPLPGSGIAPREYPSWVEIAEAERTAGRLPHLRIATTAPESTQAASTDASDQPARER